MAKRPSHKELTAKLRHAIEALDNGTYLIVEKERHFQNDAQILGSNSVKDHFEIVRAFLDELCASGGANCYVGKYPPYKCDHEPYKQLDLFAFAWLSKSAECRMYLKFGIKLTNQSKEPVYVYLNCHEDSPEKKNR